MTEVPTLSYPLKITLWIFGNARYQDHCGSQRLRKADDLSFPELAHCTNYLCPGTLACVSFPHHCPCAFPAVEDKVELSDGSAICVSKGGFKEGEVARKVELARMGKL